jgi:hypothetical protein
LCETKRAIRSRSFGQPLGPAEEQVVDELAARRLLLAQRGELGPFVALHERRHGLAQRAQHRRVPGAVRRPSAAVE